MISSAEAARRIIAAPAPVLFPDTCALLDLMRDPTRENFSADQVVSAKRLLQLAQYRPRALWIPITHQVWLERLDNQAIIRDEAALRLRRFGESITKLQLLMAAHGLQTSTITPSLESIDFPTVSNDLVESYFTHAIRVRNGRNIEKTAFARMAANLAPSQRGQQTKDCVVIENYLQLARILRQGGYRGKIIFLTTNTNDYSLRRGSGSLHPDLVTNFEETSLSYAVNFSMAEHLLVGDNATRGP